MSIVLFFHVFYTFETFHNKINLKILSSCDYSRIKTNICVSISQQVITANTDYVPGNSTCECVLSPSPLQRHCIMGFPFQRGETEAWRGTYLISHSCDLSEPDHSLALVCF